MGPPSTFSFSDLDYLARVDSLLIATDFDGTLAEFSDSPTDVRAVDGAVEALQDLAELPGVTVFLISGRQLLQLSDVSGLPIVSDPGDSDVRLVGSHGAEPAESSRLADSLDVDQQEALVSLGKRAELIANQDGGMWVEYKPFSVGLHTRKVSDKAIADTAEQDLSRFAEGLSSESCPVHITHGRDILELSVATATKGSYLQALLDRLPEDGPRAVLFAGDDVTDETAMAVLRQGQSSQSAEPSGRPDLGIHVGGRLADSTLAARKLSSPVAMRDVLVQLVRARRGN